LAAGPFGVLFRVDGIQLESFALAFDPWLGLGLEKRPADLDVSRA